MQKVAFTAEQAKHLTDEEYLHYWEVGLAPAPTMEVFERWKDRMVAQFDDTVDEEIQDLQDRIDELLEENERLTRESSQT